jgi:Uma2 family endonuclease
MATISAPLKITPEDLLRMPESKRFELVDGHLLEKHASVLSSRTEAKILGLIGRFLVDNAIAAAFASSFGYRCFADEPDRIRRPDVTVVLLTRMMQLHDHNPGYMPLVPDLAIEVVSTNDAVNEIGETIEEYRLAGFPQVWIAEPVARLVTIYSNPGKPRIPTEVDVIDAPNALPGFSCRVADLFPTAMA